MVTFLYETNVGIVNIKWIKFLQFKYGPPQILIKFVGVVHIIEKSSISYVVLKKWLIKKWPTLFEISPIERNCSFLRGLFLQVFYNF